MKKLFVLGICALVIVACSNTPEKPAAGTAADLTTTASNPTVTGVKTDTAAAAPATASASATTTPAATTANAPAAVAPAQTPVKAAPAKTAAVKPSAKKGEALIATLDCLVCHKPTVKIIGPAFSDIGKKYPATDANVTMLADKIVKGGSGNWGQVPMSPHPQVSVDDAKSLALYVLSFK
jgi:cytochrome c